MFDTGIGPGNRDIILDFQQGKDVIDLAVHIQRTSRPTLLRFLKAVEQEPRARCALCMLPRTGIGPVRGHVSGVQTNG